MDSSIIIEGITSSDVLSGDYLFPSKVTQSQHSKITQQIKQGVGIVIKNSKREPYIITCNNSISNCRKLYGYLKVTQKGQVKMMKCELTVEHVCYGYDLALLSFTNKKVDKIIDKLIHCVHMDDFVDDLSDDFLKDKQYKMKNPHTEQTESYKLINIEEKKLYSINLPHTLIINMQKDEEKKENDFDGQSGSCMTCSSNNSNSNSIIGLAGSYDQTYNTLHVIPSVCIKRFIDECEQTNGYDGISVVPFKGMIKDGKLSVVDNYGLSCYRLKENDVMESLIVVDKEYLVNKHGMIHLDDIKRDVLVETFIGLKCWSEHNFQINVKRNDKLTKLNLTARSIDSLLTIPLTHNQSKKKNDTVNFNGLVFAEFDEDYLRYYLSNDIHLIGTLIKDHINDPYSNTNTNNDKNHNKKVVLVDIDFNSEDITQLDEKLIEKYRRQYREIGLPLINQIDDSYFLSILTKVNKNKINNLDALINVMKDQKSIVNLYFSLDTDMGFKLGFNGDKEEVTYEALLA
jgi:hypothetical protein